MPQMGVSVSEGTITKWLKSEGETVARDEPLLEISTDKVDTEVPSPGEGTRAKTRPAGGRTVGSGTVIATMAPEGAAPSDAPAPATQPAAEVADAASSAEGEPAPSEPAAAPAPAASPPAAQPVVAAQPA